MGYKSILPIIIACLLISLLISCRELDGFNCYKGKSVLLDFKNISDIKAEQVLILDNLCVKHSVHEEDWERIVVHEDTNQTYSEDYYSFAPASEFHLYDEQSGRRLIEKNSSFLIASKLGQIIKNHKDENGNPFYTILNGQGYLIDGIIEFRKANNDNIKICVPEEYPVKLKVSL